MEYTKPKLVTSLDPNSSINKRAMRNMCWQGSSDSDGGDGCTSGMSDGVTCMAGGRD